jgi:hypothetical protein
MTMRTKLSGNCLCQSWGGNAFLAVHAEKNAAFEGEENISVHNSSLPLGLFKNIDKLHFYFANFYR